MYTYKNIIPHRKLCIHYREIIYRTYKKLILLLPIERCVYKMSKFVVNMARHQVRNANLLKMSLCLEHICATIWHFFTMIGSTMRQDKDTSNMLTPQLIASYNKKLI